MANPFRNIFDETKTPPRQRDEAITENIRSKPPQDEPTIEVEGWDGTQDIEFE